MRYSKHHKSAEIARLPRAVVAAGIGAVLLAFAFLTYTPPHAERAGAGAGAWVGVAAAEPPGALRPSPVDTTPRLVYRNSVVPGGVHSAGELAAVIARDPVAAAHYGNINVARIHPVRVDQSRLVHVSYRIGDRIFWTKNKVRLALGETVLSDGEHLIRARCGNRIADDAQGPVLINEPAAEVLETAFVSAADLIDEQVDPAAMPGLHAPAAAASAARTADAAAVEGQPAHLFAFAPASAGGAVQAGVSAVPLAAPLPVPPVINPTGMAPAAVASHSAPALLVAGIVNGAAGDGDTAAIPSVPNANDAAANGAEAPRPAAGNGDAATGTVAPGSDAEETPAFTSKPDFTPGGSVFPTAPAVKPSATIPEPGSVLLAVAALAALWAGRRRKASKSNNSSR